MKSKTSPRKIHVIKVILIAIIIGLIGVNTSFLTNNTSILRSTAADPTVVWNITLTINGSSGASNAVFFGEATNASDNKDIYDMPAPPMPPQFPAIAAWFETPFPVPFNNLIYEYKHYPSNYTEWNLSILWLPAPGNTTSTSITINWDSSQLLKITNLTLFLYENNTILANMLTTNSYSYIVTPNEPLHRFQIISQNQPSNNNSSEQNQIPLPPLFIYFLVIFMVIIIVLVLLYTRRNKSRREFLNEVEEKKTPILRREEEKAEEVVVSAEGYDITPPDKGEVKIKKKKEKAPKEEKTAETKEKPKKSKEKTEKKEKPKETKKSKTVSNRKPSKSHKKHKR
ncbi:Uncharacterised protein [uncultured archaeon]|nr:Uncharacterised protein [uncultured archaeon]